MSRVNVLPAFSWIISTDVRGTILRLYLHQTGHSSAWISADLISEVHKLEYFMWWAAMNNPWYNDILHLEESLICGSSDMWDLAGQPSISILMWHHSGIRQTFGSSIGSSSFRDVNLQILSVDTRMLCTTKSGLEFSGVTDTRTTKSSPHWTGIRQSRSSRSDIGSKL